MTPPTRHEDLPRCEQVMEAVAEHLPGDLPHRGPLGEHLRRCSRCAREARELQEACDWLNEPPEPSLQELAEARLGLRRRIALEPVAAIPGPPTAEHRLRLHPALLRAAAFVAALGLMVPLAASFPSPLSGQTQTAQRPLDGAPVVDEVWRSVRSRAGRLEEWTPRWRLDEWFGVIREPRDGMLPSIPTLVPPSAPAMSRSG